MIVMAVSAALPRAANARTGEPIVTSDLLRLRTVGEIAVARDGSRAVYTVRSIERIASSTDAEPKYAARSHLWLVELTAPDARPRQLTFGARHDVSPALSPDGRTVAFVRRGEDRNEARESKGQVWLLPLTGGEARPLTNFERGASRPVWSPDGLRLLVASRMTLDEIDGVPTWPLERPRREWNDAPREAEAITPRPDGTRAEIRAWLERNAEKDNPTVITRLNFQDERALREAMTFEHFFLLEARSNEPITRDAAKRITSGFYDHRAPAFMPDGERIVFVKRKHLNEHPDRVLEHDLWIVRTDGTEERLLIAYEGWTLGSPRPSLDGSVVAFTARQSDEPTYRQTRLGLASTRVENEPSQPIWLTERLDASVSSFEWMSARGAIVFSTAREGTFPLMTISPGLLEPSAVVPEAGGDSVGVHVFGVGGGAIVYSETSVRQPCRLMARTPQGTRELIDLNPWVRAKQLSMPEMQWFERPDGTRVQMWIMPPTNVEPGKKYPLVLAMHGGPSVMWGPGEASMWHEFQLLCSWGYGIVYANPRGSGGYGYRFQKANYQNWGAGPAGDCLAAVDRALMKEWVDADRLVITGGSYAGYLTAWIIAHDQRFKAAVAQRGVYDLTTFFGEGNAWRLVPWAFGGYPWESPIRTILQRESPFTQVLRIRTPLLITHASQDLRTGVSQSEMLYRALKVLGRPVEYVRYPDAGHDLSRTGDSIQRMDRLNRIIEFFDRYVENDRPAPVVAPTTPPVSSDPPAPITTVNNEGRHGE